MDLRYSGKLTKQEYLALTKLNNRRVLKSNGFHLDFWVIMIAIGAIFLTLAVVTVRQWDLSRSGSFPWYLVEFIVGLILIGFALKIRGIPSRFWDENQEVLSKIEGRISDEVIELFTPNGNLTINWSELDGYGEYQGIMVLYKPPLWALPFLERFFERKEDWKLFNQLVLDRLPLSHRVNQIGPPKPGTLPVYILFIISILTMIIYYFLHEG